MGRVTHLVNLSGIVPLPIIMTSNLPLNSTSFSSLFYGFEASIHFFWLYTIIHLFGFTILLLSMRMGRVWSSALEASEMWVKIFLLFHWGSSPSDSAHPRAQSTAYTAGVELGIEKGVREKVHEYSLHHTLSVVKHQLLPEPLALKLQTFNQTTCTWNKTQRSLTWAHSAWPHWRG